MPTYDANDIVELKNRKKRRKRRIKLLIFLLIAAAAGGLYYTRETWLPKLQGIGEQYQTIINDGRLAEGNFPIEINGGSEYQLKYSDDTVMMLCDAYMYYYNTDGGLIKKRQHAFSNPLLAAAGGNALIFESGGDELVVENADTIMYTKKFGNNNIMFARISAEGYTAVVTTSGSYACELTVFNEKGKNIYSRKCVERISDIDFVDESEGCVLSYIDAADGTLITKVQKLNFTESEPVYTSAEVDTLGMETYGFGSGAFVLGMTSCAYTDSNGNISSYYKYDGDFAGGDSKGGKAAIIINDDDRRKYSLLLFDKAEGEPVAIDFDSPLKDVQVYDGLAYVMSKTEISAYDFSGSIRSTAAVSDSYSSFRRSDEHIFLMSYNRIDRIDYNS